MKPNKITTIFLLIILACINSINAQDYFVTAVSEKNATFLTVDEKDIFQNFLSQGGLKTVEFSTNLQIKSTSNQTWCKTKITNNVLEIEAEANDNENKRETVVMLCGKDNKSQKIEIVQLGTKPNILINEKSIEVNQNESSFTLGISSNIVFTIDLPWWVSGPAEEIAMGFKNYKFTLEEILQENSFRQDTIFIRSNDNSIKTIKIPVTQSHIGYPRFAVISDIHFGNSTGEGPNVKVTKAINNLYKKGIDALFICGDLTDWGTEAQWKQLENVMYNKDIINQNLKVYYMMGNHDHYNSPGAVCEELYKKYTKQSLHQYIDLKGYPFISISMNGTSWSSYSDESITFLKESLQDASKKYPGKPIFVFTHVPPKGTVYGSNSNDGNWGTDKFENVLKNYPQVVIFSGHSHYPLGDPRSIDQKNYTAINDGSTTYSEIESGAVDAGIHPEKYDNITEGVIVNIDGDKNVTVERWDTYRDEEIAPQWTVNAPHDGSAFIYKNRTGGESPLFALNTTISISSITERGCNISFNQATDDEVVVRYKIEIIKDGKTIKTQYIFSGYYLNSDMPNPISCTLASLPSGSILKLKITAIDSYNKESAPIYSDEFSTKGNTDSWVLPTQFPNDKIVGWWEFNNQSSPGKATKGNDAILKGEAAYELVEGVGTIRIEKDANGSYKNYISIAHGLNNNEASNKYVRNYCIVMDAKLDLDKSYTSLYRFGSTGDSDIFARGAGYGTIGAIGLNGAGLGYSPTLAQVGWNRIIVNANLDENSMVIYACYPDGTVKKYDKTGSITAIDRLSIITDKEIMVAGDDDGENGNLNIGQLVLFGQTLTDDEITSMLKAWKDGNSITPPTNFPSANLAGLWQFNDAQNPGKAITGTDATLKGEASYSEADGKGTVRIEQDASGLSFNNYISIAHGLQSDESSNKYVRDYTLVMDAKLDLDKSYTALYRFGSRDDSDFFARGAGYSAVGAIGLNGGGLGYSGSLLQTGWNRIVVNAKLSENTLVIYVCYPDGTINKYDKTGSITDPDRFSIVVNSPIMISGDDDRENGNLNVAQLALYSKSLTDEEIASLLVSWGEEEDITPENPIMEIEKTEFVQNFAKNANTQKVTIDCNGKFTAVSSAKEWCNVEVDNSKKADNLTITVDENNSQAIRTAQITLNSKGTKSINITVNQTGKGAAVLVKESFSGIELNETALNFTLNVTTNQNVEFTLPQWITKNETVGVPQYSFSATQIPNDISERDDTIIAYVQGGNSVKIAVKQMNTSKMAVNFIVLSDTHFDRESAGEDATTRAKKVLQTLLDKNKNSIDAIFIVGDMTDNGSESQWTSFKKVYYESGIVPSTTSIYPMIGNHDLYTGTRDESHARFLKYTGLENVNNYVIIKGVPFITISQDQKVESAYNTKTIQYVKRSLADAAKKCPGKPIFVFSHLPVKGTTVASNQGSTELGEIFKQYPQIIFFAAHTHHSIVDPRSIYQNEYTAINTGTAWYSEVDGGMIGGIEPPGHDKVTEGQIVKIAGDNNVTVERWDAFRDEQIMEPYTINKPHNGTQFLYKGRTGGSAPVFAAGAKPIAVNIKENGCEIRWPQASDDDKVYRYKVNVKKSNDETSILNAQIFSEFYWNSDMPDTLSFNATGLTLNTEYFAVVSALDAFGKESTPIRSDNFKMKQYEPTSQPPVADLFDIAFRSGNGNAYDRSEKNFQLEVGSEAPSYKFDPTINAPVGVFPGKSASHYKLWYKGNTEFKNALDKSFTIETFIYKPNTDATCPVSAQQQGGFGIEFSGNVPELFAWIGGGYKKATPQGYIGSTTQYMHLLYTYDKSTGKMCAYVDGVLMGETSVSGNLGFPSNEQAHWIGIGADCNVYPAVDYAMAGNIAFARLYSKAVTGEDAYNLFYQTIQRKRITGVEQLVQYLSTDLPAKAASSTGSALQTINNTITQGWKLISNWATTQTEINSINNTCVEILK